MSHTKPVEGFPGYEISNEGEVFSVKSNWRGYGKRRLIPILNSYGYPGVRIVNGKSRRHLLTHTLVLAHFGPPRPSIYHEARHRDGNKQNNHICNLEWGTQKQNAEDRESHGKTSRGERHSIAIKNGLKQSDRARLIAAASELLAALKDVESAFNEEPITGDARLDGMMAKVKTAIANAEGRT